MELTGKCLCEAVTFSITGSFSQIYICHCSRCRRASGTSGEAMLTVPADYFQCKSGEDQSSTYTSNDGFRAVFCKSCGSPLPRTNLEGDTYWVPAGLISEPSGLSVFAHIYVDSKADWDEIAGNGEKYGEHFT